MMNQTRTASATYTVVDIENVVRRVKADLVMIADSTGGWTAAEARDYAHDIEVLAKAGYLTSVDVTLFRNRSEIKAVRFDVNTDAGSLSSSRPGGVLWPKVPNPYLRIVLRHTSAYDAAGKGQAQDPMDADERGHQPCQHDFGGRPGLCQQ